MLRGVPPYREAFNMKFPGAYAAYAMLMAVFGQTIEGIPTRHSEGIVWPHTREQVAEMTAFEAKDAGAAAEKNMKKMGIDWVTFEGKRMKYRSKEKAEHYRLIVAAMRAKLEQNPKVREILLATGDLILRPDHIQEPDPPPEWQYFRIWMDIRSELR